MRPTTSAASIFIANLRLVCPWFVGGSETGENDLIAAIEAEAAGVTLDPQPDTASLAALSHGVTLAPRPGHGAALREAVVHAARDVDGVWFPQDDNWTGTDLTFWGPEAGEALRDLRTAVTALDDAEAAGVTLDPRHVHDENECPDCQRLWRMGYATCAEHPVPALDPRPAPDTALREAALDAVTCRPSPDDPWHCVTHDGRWLDALNVECDLRLPMTGDDAALNAEWESGYTAGRDGALAALSPRPAPDTALDVERLARALAATVLMQRYAAYANGSPTLRHGTPEFHAKEWAPFIAREYAVLDANPVSPRNGIDPAAEALLVREQDDPAPEPYPATPMFDHAEACAISGGTPMTLPRLAVGVIGQNIVIDCGTHEEALRLASMVTLDPRPAPDTALLRDVADIVRRAPSATCDLTGAKHHDLVERRTLLALLSEETDRG